MWSRIKKFLSRKPDERFNTVYWIFSEHGESIVLSGIIVGEIIDRTFGVKEDSVGEYWRILPLNSISGFEKKIPKNAVYQSEKDALEAVGTNLNDTIGYLDQREIG